MFLWVEQNDTIELVRKKLSAVVKTPADNIRILSADQKSLEDNKTIQDFKIENDNIVYWVQKKGNIHSPLRVRAFTNVHFCPDDGSWEEVNLQKIETNKPEEGNTNA